MFKDKIIELINKKAFTNKEVIQSLILPSIGFKIELKEIESSLSSIGGCPPIDGFQIPSLGEKPLTLIAKIVLNEISEINNLLPREGILYFYICSDDLGYRFPDKNDEFKVIYLENSSEANDNLLKIDNSIKKYPISFFEYFTFPSYHESIIKKNNINDDEINIISDIEEELMFSINEEFVIPHQILGHPTALQGTVKFWWAAKYLEINTNNEISNEEMKRINEIEEDFILLLQLNFNDSKIEIDNFGDSIVYFGIHKADLSQRDFSKVILEMQNT